MKREEIEIRHEQVYPINWDFIKRKGRERFDFNNISQKMKGNGKLIDR